MLQIEGLYAGYGPGHVLFDINVDVNPGEIVCLLGRNGAGKSTTLKAIVGLVAASAGRIQLSGRELTGRMALVK